MPYRGAGRPAAASTSANAPRSSARWMASGLVPDDGHACRLQRARQAQRGLPAELDDHARHRPAGLLGMHHLEHVLQGQRLEVQPAGGVVVGGDGLRVAVDHDRLVAGLGQRERGVHAGVVELDALPDPVRPAAQDDHLGPVPARDLGLVVVGRVQVGGPRGELGRAGVHRVEDRPHAETPADLADAGLAHPAQLADLRVGEPGPLGHAAASRLSRCDARRVSQFGDFLDVGDLVDEPGVDGAGRHHVGHAGPGAQRLVHGAQPAVVRDGAAAQQFRRVAGRFRQLNGAPRDSIDRSAFCSASGNERPIAMASPTDFMCVVSSVSALGNFSNANLGILTTT